ncbi:hypothetical protein D3C71_2119320 [compost metagenome]
MGKVATNEKQTESGIVREFIGHISADTKPTISGEEGLKSLKVILAALKSAETGQIVRVK